MDLELRGRQRQARFSAIRTKSQNYALDLHPACSTDVKFNVELVFMLGYTQTAAEDVSALVFSHLTVTFQFHI